MRIRSGALTALTALLLATAAVAATPRASLTDIENDVMCVSCHEPLSVAASPQALSERDYIRMLIARGETKPQIERALVAQYGQSVLGRPPADGFNLTIYVLPPALLLVALGALAYALPRWRRRARVADAESTATARPDPSEARRLEEDLARFN
jgi:cytochrome c-type biogenesis protein CcmH